MWRPLPISRRITWIVIPSMEDYVRAKTVILAHQGVNGWAILNADDERTLAMTQNVRGEYLSFSLRDKVKRGGFIAGDNLILRLDHETRLCSVSEIRLRGRHNLANTLTAACCALAAGATPDAIRGAATRFTGVPHRLEPVRTLGGTLYVNDSIATSPERAVAALQSYDEPLILLAGGRDKHLPWDEWALCVREKARMVIAFGEAAPIVERALAQVAEQWSNDSPVTLDLVDTMEEAVQRAAEIAQNQREVVLLSPGGTSFDAFEDFAARGQRFRDLVATL